MNRPSHNWEAVDRLEEGHLPSSRIFNKLQEMIALRKKIPVFTDDNNLEIHDPVNPHLFVFERSGEKEDGILVVANFDEHPQILDSGMLEDLGFLLEGTLYDVLSNKSWKLSSALVEIQPYQL